MTTSAPLSRSYSFTSGASSAWGGSKAGIINQLIMNGGDLNKLPRNLRQTFMNAASPEEFKEYTGRNTPASTTPAAPTQSPVAAPAQSYQPPAPAPSPTASPASPDPAPSGNAGGGLDANALMEMYQKGLGAGAASVPKSKTVEEEAALLNHNALLSRDQANFEQAQRERDQSVQTQHQLYMLERGNNLDLARKRVEQDMQMEGQKQALAQSQQARAKERDTEATLQRRQQDRERSNAMSAFRGL
jgi:hypothetical protein